MKVIKELEGLTSEIQELIDPNGSSTYKELREKAKLRAKKELSAYELELKEAFVDHKRPLQL